MTSSRGTGELKVCRGATLTLISKVTDYLTRDGHGCLESDPGSVIH